MGSVKVLPEHIANKIAAGEVVERPASIVKELVENSLDAGATVVEVSIKNGGKSLIRVSDNGVGMTEEDAALAFKRHATSKISTVQDLDRIGSYGFRGEALPSIGAVARVKMATCREGEPVGCEISIEGGKEVYVKGAPARLGTMIEVRDLFFNTPARRKFLKADSTEMGHIVDTLSNLALARLDVHFILESSGRKLLDLVPVQNLKDRVAAVFSDDMTKNLLEVDSKVAGIRVYGLIGKPYLNRANRTGQYFFINNRWVKSAPLGYALHDGYHGVLMHGQFPVAVVFIDVDLEQVDVNVHPTKQEVRISNEPEIKSFLKKVVTERLIKAGDIVPSLKPAAAKANMPYASYDSLPASRLKQELDPGIGGQGSGVRFADRVTDPGSPAPDPSAFPPPDPRSLASGPSDQESGIKDQGIDFPTPAPRPLTPELDISFRGQLRITKILGQVHNTFLIAETDEGMIVIDQHAAHERVMFEALLKNLESGQPEKQGLLMEEVLDLHPRQVEFFKHALPVLEKAGFEIDEFGEHAFVVRAYPAIFKDENPIALLRCFVEEKEEGKIDTKLGGQKEDVAALIACKRKSVKAFDPMSLAAIHTLLDRLARCENPFNCPHGRPTFFKQTFADLERQFKRK